jgi:hypothetical protein
MMRRTLKKVVYVVRHRGIEMLSLTILLLAGLMSFIFADTSCSPCACTGMANCNGCVQPQVNGFDFQGYVSISGTLYYTCEGTTLGNDPYCNTTSLICWSAPGNVAIAY